MHKYAVSVFSFRQYTAFLSSLLSQFRFLRRWAIYIWCPFTFMEKRDRIILRKVCQTYIGEWLLPQNDNCLGKKMTIYLHAFMKSTTFAETLEKVRRSVSILSCIEIWTISLIKIIEEMIPALGLAYIPAFGRGISSYFKRGIIVLLWMSGQSRASMQ